MQGKKASVEVQFNWIFIIIAGAAILMLFASILVKQKSSADSEGKSTLLRTMGSLIVGAQSSPGITNTIDLPKATLSFECDRIRIGSSSRVFAQMMVFAPFSIDTPRLILHTKEWSIPYKATNVVYVSSPHIRYVIVANSANSQLARDLKKLFPEKIKVEIVESLREVTNQNDEHVRLIFLNQDPLQIDGSFSDVSNSQITALKVDGDFYMGNLYFYQKSGTTFSTPTQWTQSSSIYFGKEILLGAIFSENPDQYSCSLKNAVRKAALVTGIYHDRAIKLKDQTTQSKPECSLFYDSAIGAFEDVSTFLISSQNPNEGFNAVNTLISTNSQLEKKSCPLVY